MLSLRAPRAVAKRDHSPRRARCFCRLRCPDDPTADVAFTTSAFVGRIDVAVSLSQKPQLLPAEMEAAWERARILPIDSWEGKLRQKAMAVWEATDRGTLQAVGVLGVATVATAVLVACFQLGCFQPVRSVARPL